MEALALLIVLIVWFLHSRKINELNKRISALETDLTEYWKEISLNQTLPYSPNHVCCPSLSCLVSTTSIPLRIRTHGWV